MEKTKLTKAEIVENIKRKNSKLNREDIHHVIDDLFDELKAGLTVGKTIELRGFGTFEVRTRAGRKRARNPKTGEIVSVDDHSVVFFRPGKELQDSICDLSSTN